MSRSSDVEEVEAGYERFSRLRVSARPSRRIYVEWKPMLAD